MNLFTWRRNQLSLEKLMQNVEKINSNNNLNQNKRKMYEENKNTKPYSQQESRFNLKQILKHYSLYRESRLNGFNRKYINLFTDLLYENNSKNYSSKRLSLVNFRKKIIKNNITLSFENFIQTESPHEHYKQEDVYISNVKKQLDKLRLKFKNKNKFNSTNKAKNHQLKEGISSINFLKKYNLKINLDDTTKTKTKTRNKEINKFKSFSGINTPFDNQKTGTNKQLRTINSYTYKKNNDEAKKYIWDMNPRDELLERNNKIKFVDYLNSKYAFYKYKTLNEKKNLKEMRKRQNLYNKNKFNIKNRVEFNYKKEFFGKINRLKLKDINRVNLENLIYK